jgi:archaemetzincin
MNRSKIIFLIFIFSVTFYLACNDKAEPWECKNVIIDIQPFAGFSNELIKQVAKQIQKIYPYVTIRSEISLPISSFYPPRNRYRADSIIAILRSRTTAEHVTIGLTNKDISTTNGNVKDWGIIGLGYRPGNACVVSTFRLNKENLSNQFYKACIHELGHTTGLDHCPEKTCFMRDANGGNPIDEEIEFCAKCRNILIKKGWNIKATGDN